MPIPRSPEALTCEWLTEALRLSGRLSGTGFVASFDSEPVGEGWAFTGRLARLTLHYEAVEGDPPDSLVAKFPNPSARLAADPVSRQRLNQRNEREVLFYQQIGRDAGIRTPSLYYGAAGVDAGEFVLLLEDLAPGRIGDAMAGCSWEDAALLVPRIADFHAIWWEHPRLAELGWLHQWGQAADAAQSRLRRSRGPFLDKFGRWLPGRVRELLDDLTPVYASVLKELGSSPRTMIHADLHLDNILFDVPDSPVAVVDWQGVACGRGAIDLRHVVFEALEINQRRAVETDLLRLYHSTLLKGGVERYDFGRLLHDCRLALLQLLGGVVNGYATFDMKSVTGREREMVRTFFEQGKLFAALLDHGAGDLVNELTRSGDRRE